GDYGARNIHFGVREHGMGAMVNGFAYDGFFIPYGATFLLFSDYMRPPIRLAALSRLQSLFVYTHDSIFLGEDGPTHQPLELPASQQALQLLDPGLRGRTRLVSMPCVERFLEWPADERSKLLPRGGKAKLVAVEAALGLDWYRLIGDGLVVGIDRFGASAPE